jgi:hypothetical protein
MAVIKPKPTKHPRDRQLETALVAPKDFRFAAVDSVRGVRAPRRGADSEPALGPLQHFTGTFTGAGFNTIFRPQSTATPTQLPTQVSGDNVLELNLTSEILSFSKSLGSVPNRGMVQGDIFLNGVPYLQTVRDITDPNQTVDIHFEPGLWMAVPSTTDPAECNTVVRMASIPHGTTITAQGTSSIRNGPPTIPPVDITPTFNQGINPGGKQRFPSQTATDTTTARIPQDLTGFIAAGTITQNLLDDPNSLLRNHIASQDIISTVEITIATNPQTPLFGGGADNIAFLLGDAAALTDPRPPGPNAQTLSMRATFWIETVRHEIVVPPNRPAHRLTPVLETHIANPPAPRFELSALSETAQPRTLTVTSTQIQYSQIVLLNFNALTWPHVSVATLVPHDPIPISWP